MLQFCSLTQYRNTFYHYLGTLPTNKTQNPHEESKYFKCIPEILKIMDRTLRKKIMNKIVQLEHSIEFSSDDNIKLETIKDPLEGDTATNSTEKPKNSWRTRMKDDLLGVGVDA